MSKRIPERTRYEENADAAYADLNKALRNTTRTGGEGMLSFITSMCAQCTIDAFTKIQNGRGPTTS